MADNLIVTWDISGDVSAALIAAVVALILAIGQGLSARKNRQKNNAIMLIQLMASAPLHEARSKAAEFLRVDQGGDLVEALRALPQVGTVARCGMCEDCKTDAGPERSISAVIGFYELVYGLIGTRAVDHRMLKMAFGQRTAFFYEYLYLKYWSDRQSEWRFALDKLGRLRHICDEDALAYFADQRRRQRQRRLSKSTEVSVPPDTEG
ncbi:hypothetical protein [Neorhizobium sp. JUb45]|uniref:hypothetical protein n=1 Tax=unclassified Neorhizobium TaxID=2629175 RepID=UPI00104F5C82|nr:hypothetical protein [Neorhizobium sp. JUb45]TCR04975.1 hypothetical protein EDF70_1021091 [Neorhizobium sp. JUb45]